MGKRIFLFLLTNLAIVLVLSIVLSLLGFGGYLGPDGQLLVGPLAVFCFVWGMGGALISLAISRWVARRAVGARLVDGHTGQEPLDWLHATVGNLARQANLPMPQVGVYDSPEVNAFATGPTKKRSLVCVSTGLLGAMERREIEAVLGHELGHIANGDMVTMTLLQGVVNTCVLFFARVIAYSVRLALDRRIAVWVGFLVRIALEIVLGILGSLVTAWYSRRREFRADAAGATLAGREAMAAALRRLLANQQRVDTASHPALAAFKIAGGKSWLAAFATHPPLAERIAALESGRLPG
jgi:heat shock protein HtpX